MLKTISEKALPFAIDGRLIPGSAAAAARDTETLVRAAKAAMAAEAARQAAEAQQAEADARERGYRDGLEAAVGATLSIAASVAAFGASLVDRAQRTARDELCTAMRGLGVEEAVVAAMLAAPIPTPTGDMVLTIPTHSTFDPTRLPEHLTRDIAIRLSHADGRMTLDIGEAVLEFAVDEMVDAAVDAACALTEDDRQWLAQIAAERRCGAMSAISKKQQPKRGKTPGGDT